MIDVSCQVSFKEIGFRGKRGMLIEQLKQAQEGAVNEVMAEMKRSIDMGSGLAGHPPESYSGVLSASINKYTFDDGRTFIITCSAPYATAVEHGTMPKKFFPFRNKDGTLTRVGEWAQARGFAVEAAQARELEKYLNPTRAQSEGFTDYYMRKKPIKAVPVSRVTVDEYGVERAKMGRPVKQMQMSQEDYEIMESDVLKPERGYAERKRGKEKSRWAERRGGGRPPTDYEKERMRIAQKYHPISPLPLPGFKKVSVHPIQAGSQRAANGLFLLDSHPFFRPIREKYAENGALRFRNAIIHHLRRLGVKIEYQNK